jgi:acyl-CoA thioesterase
MTELPPALASMYAADRVAHGWGITVGDVGPGTATIHMTVTKSMTNGLGVCHGGILFAFADTAMAYGSNEGGDATFSTNATIEWVAPAREGTRLSATSTRVATRGKSAVHDIIVTDDAGETVALVRGQTLSTGRSVVDISDAHAD